MNATVLAQRAYGAGSAPAKTPRDIEYDVFARVTRDLNDCNGARKVDYPQYVAALDDNRRLWEIVAESVADKDNALPSDLRARLFYLAEFTLHQTSKIVRERLSADVLIEINKIIMSGLRPSTAS